MNMSTISTCIIIKNEIENIPLLINDLRQFSDEIIVVDTGSTDGTSEWLEENKDDVLKLYHFTWTDHFAEARNYSLSKATMEWMFWCDADDRISEKLINDINNIKPMLNNMEYNCYYINYIFGPNTFVPRIRLLKMEDQPYWVGACHEYVYLKNDVKYSYDTFDNTSNIIHQRDCGHPERNIKIFINTILEAKSLADISSRDMYYFSNELRDNGYLEKSYKVSKLCLTYSDLCIFDYWNCILYNLFEHWLSSEELSKEGINYIIQFIEKFHELRGDIWYCLASLYNNIKDYNNYIKCCENALTSVTKGISTFGENLIFSKIFPAFDIYINAKDLNTKVNMINHLIQYEDLTIVKEFFEENNILNIK